jgi:hypothetical protein
VRFEKQIDEQQLDGLAIVADPVVERHHPRRCVLQPIERRHAGRRRAIAVPCRPLPGQRRQHRIEAQPVMVDQILVPQRDGEYRLAD